MSASEVEARLQELLAQGQQAWPEFTVDADAFVRSLAKKEDLAPLRGPDLYLVFACLGGDKAALRALDSGYLVHVPQMLGRLRLSAEENDEVQQRLRHRLLIGTDQGPPRLAKYAGRGDLRNWIRTAAVRVAQSYIDADARQPRGADLSRAVDNRDLQLDYLRREYGREFKLAFETSVTELTDRERNLLRFHYIDGVTSDGLSAMYGVHRATAARWVAASRDKLATATRRHLMAKLGVGRADLQSILRLINSQLDASVRRCLSERP